MNYNRRKEVINQVSRADWFSQDSYYWLANSFQYSENINADDELHWIKLSQKIYKDTNFANCQLVTVWDQVFAFPFLDWWKIYRFKKNSWNGTPGWWGNNDPIEVPWISLPNPDKIPWWDTSVGEATLFQNKFWISLYAHQTGASVVWLYSIDQTWNGTGDAIVPNDHKGWTDEDISTPEDTMPMTNAVTCILNFNNSRLLVASWNELRCYYPELHTDNPWHQGETWWKKVQTFRWWQTIIALTCTFEYLKVWVQDAWYSNTKVFYYQANDDFRSTFVYNQIDLKNVKVMRVYSINWIDYFTESLDWTDWFVSLNKLIGSTPVQIFTRRWWLVPEDIFNKSAAWYFIWPTSLDADYQNGNIYIADAHWVFKFKYNPSWVDKWYLKWKCRNTKKYVTGLAICENYLYVSYEDWICKMRLYDTGQDWYESSWILISREFEWNSYQWCFTKMLDQIRVNYELNYLLDVSWGAQENGKIEIFISPNNKRTDTNPSWDGSDWWYKVMEITWDMKNTRTQTTNLLNSFSNNDWETWFEYDRQTITYLVRISIGANDKATPIVREVQLWYHTKGKANELYDLQNPENG